MAGTPTIVSRSALVRLDWESNHFGLSAARLVGHDLDDGALSAALRLARQQGIRLLVWPAEGGREVPRELLDEFAGALVDRKATFSKPIQPRLADDHSQPAPQFPIVPYTATTASAALVELAISAGVYSRFRVDPHVTDEKFTAMYRLWIDRSVQHELADIVFVASLGDREAAPGSGLGGMITLSEDRGLANIGLIAVAAKARGMGIGSALMHAGLRWIQDRGAREAQVVTQLANLPACRLYERSGYQLSRVEHYYHFWL